MTDRLPLSGRFEDFNEDLMGSPDLFRNNFPSIAGGSSIGTFAGGFRDSAENCFGLKSIYDSDAGRGWVGLRLSRNMFLLDVPDFWWLGARGVSSSDASSVARETVCSGDPVATCRWLREEGSPLALNTAGVGVEFSGGHMASILYPRTLLARGAMVGRVPSETLDELVSASSVFAWTSSEELEAGCLDLPGGVGGCTIKFVGVCVGGETVLRLVDCVGTCLGRDEDDEDLLGMRGRGAPALFEV